MAKPERKSVTQTTQAAIVAFCISAIDKQWSGDKEKMLRAIAGYFGYRIIQL